VSIHFDGCGAYAQWQKEMNPWTTLPFSLLTISGPWLLQPAQTKIWERSFSTGGPQDANRFPE